MNNGKNLHVWLFSRRTFKDMHGTGLIRSHACSHVLVVFLMLGLLKFKFKAKFLGALREETNRKPTNKQTKWREINS